jgi:hypothetical protein
VYIPLRRINASRLIKHNRIVYERKDVTLTCTIMYLIIPDKEYKKKEKKKRF